MSAVSRRPFGKARKTSGDARRVGLHTVVGVRLDHLAALVLDAVEGAGRNPVGRPLRRARSSRTAGRRCGVLGASCGATAEHGRGDRVDARPRSPARSRPTPPASGRPRDRPGPGSASEFPQTPRAAHRRSTPERRRAAPARPQTLRRAVATASTIASVGAVFNATCSSVAIPPGMRRSVVPRPGISASTAASSARAPRTSARDVSPGTERRSAVSTHDAATVEG